MTAVHRLLAVAARHPDRVALDLGDRTWSYAELVQRAGGVARRLREDGAPERPVLLEALPDADWVVGVWGAWMAGAAVAPFDLRDPSARRRALADALGPVVRPRPGPLADPDPAWLPSPGDLGWIVHSSGSTGRPKGVRVSHRGVPALLDAQVSAFGLHPDARVLAVLSPGFDASLSDLMTAHTSGAALVLAPTGVLGRPDFLRRVLEEARVTHVDLPPAVVARTRLAGPLETVVMGGEVCPLDAARRWASVVRLVNVYGPTEATICTSLGRVDPTAWHHPELGTPIPGVTYREVDGELWIAGEALALGYTDADLTAQRFVHDGGERWFRTGDRVEQHGDAWVFRGRLDRMVKLQGRLAHPEELERVLVEQPGVTDAVAWAADGRLHARYAGSAPEDLRARLRERLPMWMQPATLSADAVQRTTNHKRASQRLRASVSQPRPRQTRRCPEPRSGDLLCSLWSHALGREVTPQTDLDEAGRDSTAVLEVLAAADRLELRLDPVAVATAPTPTASHLADDTAALVARVGEVPRHGRPHGPPRRLFLTGASGALGTALLPHLLRAGVEVHALVRQRVPAGVVAHHGDLTLPRFGLDDPTWRALRTLDTYVHLGADLHALQDTDEAWPTNVDGTRALLALAAGDSRVHHASTLAVFACSDRPRGTVTPDDPLPSGRIHGGYAASKWAAEHAVTEAGGVVHRLGHLVAHPDDGLYGQVRRGLGALGVSSDSRARCNLTCLHAAAEALATAILDDACERTHLVSDVHETLGELCGRPGGDATPLERALAERAWLAPDARHPSNLFLSTGWHWSGTLPGPSWA